MPTCIDYCDKKTAWQTNVREIETRYMAVSNGQYITTYCVSHIISSKVTLTSESVCGACAPVGVLDSALGKMTDEECFTDISVTCEQISLIM